MRLVITLGLVVLLCSAAWAAPTLDQQQTAQNGASSFGAGKSVGQTFTAGLSGMLTSIDLGISGPPFGGGSPTYPSTVEIRTTALGLPTNTILGSVSMAAGFVAGWNSIDFSSANISMTVGTMYAIVLSNDQPGVLGSLTDWLNVDWVAAAYPAGQLVENTGSGWYVHTAWPGEGDGQFRTYVDAGSPIPAPGALLLVGLGSALVTCLRRRRVL